MVGTTRGRPSSSASSCTITSSGSPSACTPPPRAAASPTSSNRSATTAFPGKAVVADLFDEVGEAAARGGGVHAEGEPLEVIVHDEALEEGLPLVVPTIEREHGAVPGGADGEDDQRSHAEVQPPEAVPLAGDDAVEERNGPRKREAEQPLGERREAHQAEEGRRPAFARLILEEHDHQAGHRAIEQPHETRM